MDLILNSRTEKKLNAIKQDLPHAILLTGEKGVGLTTIARELAGKNIAGLLEPLDSKGNSNQETGTISVEIIRTLYEQTRAKTSSRQVVIIDNADRMSAGAQAAFLKLLEEPTENTSFVLTAHALKPILPTIKSRVQTIFVEPITDIQTSELIDKLALKDIKTKKQLEYLASGLPAELQRLSSDDAYFKQRAEIMGDTRTFLTGSTYDRLLIVHKYNQDRANSLQLIDSALMVSERTLNTQPSQNIITQLERLLRVKEKVEGNCNIKLQLTAFVLH